MNLTRDRVHSIGWVSVLLVCGALTLALTLRVNAVKSQVHATEVRIVAAQRSIDFLQTEFQTRANQQQLRTINDLEFGYKAPGAGQYVEGERSWPHWEQRRDRARPARSATPAPKAPMARRWPMLIVRWASPLAMMTAPVLRAANRCWPWPRR